MSVLDGPLVFVDIETTGLNYRRDRVIEIAAIRIENGGRERHFNSLIDPGGSLPPFISNLTGIREADLTGAPSFYDIAGELYDILDGAVFVAHNARFDYGFLKQEFKNCGQKLNPKLLCTVRLSRDLYPDAAGHKLQDLIERCGLETRDRHRALDDAEALWQFIQHIQSRFPAPRVEAALRRQIKSPSLPRNLPPELIENLPEAAGVYIFEDETGSPLYIGKSINVKKRVQSHFSADHSYTKEFKITQQVCNIETMPASGELGALLLESKLIKERQPLYNRQLRRSQKLTLARKIIDENGYIHLSIEDVLEIEPDDIQDILGVYTTKDRAREFLEQTIKDFGLCPRLMGVEKGRGSCFSYQLKRCRGACAGLERADDYNSRLLAAFENRRLAEWPYRSPIMITEIDNSQTGGVVVDQWCVIASVSQEPDCEPEIKLQNKLFDLDTYKILRSYLASKPHKLNIKPIAYRELNSLAGSALALV